MDGRTLGLLELLLVFGLVLGVGLRELWLLRRDRDAPRDEDDESL